MVSIIIPVYNMAHKLIKTLESLRTQTYQDFELIVVNDGSRDNVEETFSRYIKTHNFGQNILFINQPNHGAPSARNHGERVSKGEYLFFCDADATLKPEALKEMLNTLLNHPEASYAYSSFYWGAKLFKVGECNLARLKQGPCIHTMALVRRSDFPAGGWDESIKKFQDWDLWLTMAEQGKIGYFINKILFTIAPGGSISNWLPAFAYKYCPWLDAVKRYNNAFAIIKKKHNLS